MDIRIGNGYDVHRLVAGRPLILCGVTIPYGRGLLGHSDADVAAHAVMDALLGAAALGDIGKHFPPNDPAYAGADSLALLDRVVALLKEHGYTAGNIDCVIVAEAPKLSAYIGDMRANLARVCGVPLSRVSVKATTEEGLGLCGEGMATHAVVTVVGEQLFS